MDFYIDDKDIDIQIYIFNPYLRVCLLFLETEEGGERERERETSVASCRCPDRGWNPQPFGAQDDEAQTNWAAGQGTRGIFSAALLLQELTLKKPTCPTFHSLRAFQVTYWLVIKENVS